MVLDGFACDAWQETGNEKRASGQAVPVQPWRLWRLGRIPWPWRVVASHKIDSHAKGHRGTATCATRATRPWAVESLRARSDVAGGTRLRVGWCGRVGEARVWVRDPYATGPEANVR